MRKKVGKIERKSRGGFGTFFFGTFIGFLLCIGLLVGVGCFAYFKVSPNWVNKTFKTNIDLGSDEANNNTISDFVGGVMGLIQNKDSYTLENLNEDFGIKIKDELFGINIKDLKNVAMTDLPEKIENKFGTISADELRNVNGMNLEEEMGKILNKENTYYYNSADEKLYKDSEFANLVSFEYTLSEDKSKVTTKGHEEPILAGKVDIPLWYLPLTVALGDFTSNMGEQISLAELEADYGVTLPSFFNSVDKANTSINELESAINGLYVADILGYTLDSTDPDNIIVKDGDDNTVTGVMSTIAKYKVDELEEGIKTLKLSQIFKPEQLQTGILSLFTTDPTIDQIPAAIEDVIAETNISTLHNKGIITLNAEDAAKLTVYVDHDGESATPTVTVGSLTIDELLNYCFEFIPNA